jgi:hypothetical protein
MASFAKQSLQVFIETFREVKAVIRNTCLELEVSGFRLVADECVKNNQPTIASNEFWNYKDCKCLIEEKI